LSHLGKWSKVLAAAAVVIVAAALLFIFSGKKVPEVAAANTAVSAAPNPAASTTPSPAAETGSNTSPNAERVLSFVREKFGIPQSVNLSMEPFHNAAYAGYLQTNVLVDDGKEKRSSLVSVSANGRYLILSDFLPIGPDSKAEIIRQVKTVFKLPETIKLSVGPIVNSPYPGFSETTVMADNQGHEQKQKYYVTEDKRFLVLGAIFNMDVDPRRNALSTIKLDGQPSQGPANAPVTIVEYADLECPTCAREHEFLQKELLPKYGDKVRIVYKEFPLVQAHPWSLTAAIASQCAFREDPSKYLAYRSSIFEHQPNISATSARDLLLYYGQQIGLDRLKLAACIDSQASRSRVEENLREGQALGVDRTPTFFINGRILVGGAPDLFYQSIDEALRAAP
jgi:protein-disulfide isomerase